MDNYTFMQHPAIFSINNAVQWRDMDYAVLLVLSQFAFIYGGSENYSAIVEIDVIDIFNDLFDMRKLNYFNFIVNF